MSTILFRIFRCQSVAKSIYQQVPLQKKNNIIFKSCGGTSELYDDVLFDMLKNEGQDLLSIAKFLTTMEHFGISRNDPRMHGFITLLQAIFKERPTDTASPETLLVDKATFARLVATNRVLIGKSFRDQLIIPNFQGFCNQIAEFYWKLKENKDGKVANYIPQLAKVDPDHWGISICTIDGQRFSIGDTQVPFTIQSCSKPITYGIALDYLGEDIVHKYVGQEPSGRNFNELVLDYNKKPHNPMINAGAILICSLLQTLINRDMRMAEKFDFTMGLFKKLSGYEFVGFNNSVYLSERECADRNYALGFFMREYKCFPESHNFKECMDFYFSCCSLEATCESMSVMAASLANGGICPLTEEKVLGPDSVRNVLSLMHSCGMYDYSGQFAFKVGIPAKSGVAGAMLVVIPNVMGICTWSPPLDQLGNSVRGLAFCEELVRLYNFHRYDNLNHATNKKDPRLHSYESIGLQTVSLLFAAAAGDITSLRSKLLSGVDLSLSDYDGRTALHVAASEGHLECVRFLIEKCHVPIDTKDRWGNKALDGARIFRHNEIARYLESAAESPAEEKKPLPQRTE